MRGGGDVGAVPVAIPGQFCVLGVGLGVKFLTNLFQNLERRQVCPSGCLVGVGEMLVLS